MKSLIRSIWLTLAAAALPQVCLAAAFTAGNLVVYRVGDGTAALTSVATAAFLDEYSPGGALIQSIPLPTAVAGANQVCTNSGSATTEGLATTSADGAYLVGGCYAAALGTASITGSPPATTPRVIFRASSAGTIDTTTALTDTNSGGNPRGAASTNGTDLWVTGSSGGVRYVALGGTSSTQLNASTTNLRGVSIYGGQLYISAGAGAIRLATVGSGTPMTSGQTLTQLSGVPTTVITNNAFVLLDLSATVAGVDTAYVADESAGIVKYSFDGTTWTAKGTVGVATDTYRGLTASVSGGNVVLYAIRKGNELVTITDASGATGTFSGTAASVAVTGTVNKAFRSVSFAPVSATPPPTPTLSITAPVINEGNSGTSTATFAVNLDHPAPAGGVAFQVDTVDGTAAGGSDYTGIVAGNGSVAAGATSTTVAVTITGDTVYEGNETFSVNLSNITNTTNATASAAATITDDDAQPTISVGDASAVEGDSGTSQLNFPVTLSNASAFSVSFSVQTADASATAGSDYDALSTIVTIPAGSTTGNIAVTVHGDTTTEPDETFTLQLSGANGGTLAASFATGTIQNDDNVTPTFTIGNVTQTEGNSGTSNFVFTVSSNVNAPAGGFTLNVDTADGSAAAGEDYIALHGTATIAAGTNSTTVAVQVNGDDKYESDEMFSVTLSNPPAGTAIGTATGTGTISNDDALPTLSIANVTMNEGNSGTSTASFNVTLSNPSASAITFTVNTADGTATAGSDYVAIINGSGGIAAGSTSTTVAVTINGDTAVEANETFNVNLSAIATASNATASATGTISNDDFTTIMQIQGHGTASLLNTQTVTTHGVVTAKKSNGFFMQDPLGDGDLTTSDAIFVFTGATPPVTVAVGNEVTVTAKVQEFSGSTELSSSPIVVITNPVAPVQPVAYALDSNPPTNNPTTGICMGAGSTIASPPTASDGYQASNFACLDAMLVTMNDAVVTGATFGNAASDGVHTGNPTGMYATVGSQPRPFRGPGAPYPGIAGHPEIPVFNGEPEAIEIFYAGLAFNPTGFVYNAGTHFTTTGVIQGFQAASATSPIYEIYPYSMSTLTPAPTYPQAVADSAAGTLTVGSQNLLHFFNATADGADTSGYNDTCAGTGASDTCPTPAQYSARLAKWAKQVCQVLKAPVVLDVEEIENRAVAKDLADNVFGACGVTYLPYVIPGNDVSGINIGILVRSDVTVNSVTQMYKGTQTNNCSGTPPCLLNDRPPVLMQASWNGYPFALLAMYDRSLSGLGDPTRPYIGPKRAEQAAQIASIAQAWQTGATLVGAGNARQNATGIVTQGPFNIVGDASVPLIVAGDFNAYEFSDGYADVTGMIMGTADQSKNLYWYNGDPANTDTPTYVAPNPPLVDSGIKAAAGERYSFNFSGLAQEIDHIVLTQRAWRDFVSTSNARGNSDVSEATLIILDGTTAARSGDHDGQVVTLAIDRIFADGYEAQP